MKLEEILKDLLQYKIQSQETYNRYVIECKNPELRKLFMDLRDDEMRGVSELQQKIYKLESKPTVLAHIFSTRIND